MRILIRLLMKLLSISFKTYKCINKIKINSVLLRFSFSVFDHNRKFDLKRIAVNTWVSTLKSMNTRTHRIQSQSPSMLVASLASWRNYQYIKENIILSNSNMCILFIVYDCKIYLYDNTEANSNLQMKTLLSLIICFAHNLFINIVCRSII